MDLSFQRSGDFANMPDPNIEKILLLLNGVLIIYIIRQLM